MDECGAPSCTVFCCMPPFVDYGRKAQCTLQRFEHPGTAPQLATALIVIPEYVRKRMINDDAGSETGWVRDSLSNLMTKRMTNDDAGPDTTCPRPPAPTLLQSSGSSESLSGSSPSIGSSPSRHVKRG